MALHAAQPPLCYDAHRMLRPVVALVTIAGNHLTAARAWIDALWFVVPADSVTRWLLLVDAGSLVLIGLGLPRPIVAVPAVLAAGFFVLNVLGMALTDFLLGLAVFHVVLLGILT
jgi:hypothetical protein